MDILARHVAWRAGESYTYRFKLTKNAGPTTQREGEHSLDWYLRPVLELEGSVAPQDLADKMKAAEETFVLQAAMPTHPTGTPTPASPPMQRSYTGATRVKAPAPVAAALRDRRLGADDILLETWGIFTRHWRAVCLLVLAQYGASFAVQLVAGSLVAGLLGVLMAFTGTGPPPAAPPFLFKVMLAAVGGLTYTLGHAVLATIVEDDLTGQGRRYVRAMTRALTRAMALVLTSLLAFLILLFLFLLLIIPGVVWSLYYAFFTYAVVLRGVSGKKALDYSKSLVEGRWQDICRVAGALGLVFFAVNILFRLALGRAGLIYSLLSTLTTNLFIVSQVVLFLNLDYLRHGRKAAAGEMQQTFVDTTIQATVVPAQGQLAAGGELPQAAKKHPFKFGEIYRNRKGQYELVKIDETRDSMIIRYLHNGQEIEASIELQSRIWQSMSREDQPGAQTSAADETIAEPGDTAAQMTDEFQPRVTD